MQRERQDVSAPAKGLCDDWRWRIVFALPKADKAARKSRFLEFSLCSHKKERCPGGHRSFINW